jgi:peptide/nickel transport system permease protein
LIGGDITRYVVRRLAAMLLLLVAFSFAVFTLQYLAPGSVEQVMIGTRSSSPELREAIRHEYHLDRPFIEQYGIWLGGAARLDFGNSIRTAEPVTSALSSRFDLTFALGMYAFALTVGIGLPLGVLAAVRRRRLADRAVSGLSVVGASAPAFATGIVLLYVFAVLLGWFPAFGQGDGALDRLWHLTLPAIALAVSVMAYLVKFTRTATVAALEQDYVMFARARGVPPRAVLVWYALRNALIPIATAGGMILTTVLTGTVLVEVTFALPGLGSLLIESVRFKDVPMVQGITMLVAAAVIVVNLLTDVVILLVDPRIRAGQARAAT